MHAATCASRGVSNQQVLLENLPRMLPMRCDPADRGQGSGDCTTGLPMSLRLCKASSSRAPPAISSSSPMKSMPCSVILSGLQCSTVGSFPRQLVKHSSLVERQRRRKNACVTRCHRVFAREACSSLPCVEKGCRYLALILSWVRVVAARW